MKEDILFIFGAGATLVGGAWAVIRYLTGRILDVQQNVLGEAKDVERGSLDRARELHKRLDEIKDTYATKGDLDKRMDKVDKELDRMEVNMGVTNQAIREGMDRLGDKIDESMSRVESRIDAMLHRDRKE